MPGLTQAGMVAYVQQGLGFRSDQSANILTMATLVQYDELEKGTTLPRFLMVEDAPLSGLAGSPNLVVPSDFIREYNDEGAIKYIDSVSSMTYFLTKKPYDWLLEWSQTLDEDVAPPVSGPPTYVKVPTGNPIWYSLRNQTIFISPIPTVNYTLYLTYYGHDVDPAGLGPSAQNKWLTNAPGVLANLVGVRMAEDLEYDKSQAKFSARFEASLRRMFMEEAAAEAADNEFSMGELV